MKILSIDTSTMLGSVALSDGDVLVAQEQQGVPGTHSERLLSTVDHLLGLARWKGGDLCGIAVATGPGSFTGLRIGLATAKGMALALGCRIAGVSSLASLSMNGASFAGTVVPLIDARRGEVYAAAYRSNGKGRLSRRMKECALSPEDLIVKLMKIAGPLLLVGDGAKAFGATLAKAIGSRAVVAAGAQLFPQAHNLAVAALPFFAKGRGDDISSLAPNYIRRSDAEIVLDRKRGKGKI